MTNVATSTICEGHFFTPSIDTIHMHARTHAMPAYRINTYARSLGKEEDSDGTKKCLSPL
jgi:hypothetical protein